MGISHLKSTEITNLDANPPVRATAGEGQPQALFHDEGSAVAAAADAAGTTYQLVRVPTTVKVKAVRFESAAQGAGKVNLGVYYATDGRIGKPTALLVADAIDEDFFASDIDCASAVGITDVTNEGGFYPIDKRVQPLWKAVGLTKDPGGNLDIVATVHTTDITTGTGRLGISIEYTN